MQIFSYIAGAAGVGVVGGVLASLWAPSRRLTSYIQHFAAGVVIAAVTLQVAPEIQRSGAAPAVMLGGFASGGMCMVGVKWLALRIEERERRRRGMPWGLTAAAAIDTAIDGTIIGMGFALGPRVGALLALALGLELFFLTLSVGSSFRQDGASRATAIAATSGISLLLVVGAVAGTLVLRDASKSVLAAMLSFGAAALLYLVTEELLVETRVGEETLLSTAMFFLGFLAIFAFVLFGGTADPLKSGGL